MLTFTRPASDTMLPVTTRIVADILESSEDTSEIKKNGYLIIKLFVMLLLSLNYKSTIDNKSVLKM